MQFLVQRKGRSPELAQRRRAGNEASLPRPPVMGSSPFSGAQHSASIHLVEWDFHCCEIKHILAGNKAYVGRTISSPQNSRSEYLRQTESARRVHMVPVSNGRHWVWQ